MRIVGKAWTICVSHSFRDLVQSTRRKPTLWEYARLCSRLPHASQSGVSLLLQKHHGAMKLTITPGLAFTIASNSASSIALGSPEKIVEGHVRAVVRIRVRQHHVLIDLHGRRLFTAGGAARGAKRPMNPLAPASSHIAAAAHAAHAASDARDAQEVSQCESMYAAF